MAGAAYAPNWVLSGNGTVTVEPFKTYRVSVIAYDNTNARVSTGGEIFILEIKNKCTPDAYHYCTEVDGSPNVLTYPIIEKMVDNGDGTYHSDYSLPKEGTVTMQVILAGKLIKWE